MKVKLSTEEYLRYCSILLIPFFAVLVFGYPFFKMTQGVIFGSQYFSDKVFIIPLLLTWALIWKYWDEKLLIRSINYKLSEEDFTRLIQVTSKELNCYIQSHDSDHALLYRVSEDYIIYGGKQYFNDPKYGGERIEIIRNSNGAIYANSISNPQKEEGVYSKSRNIDNINALKANCKALLANLDMEEDMKKREEARKEEFWTSSEWTLPQILKRLMGYGMTLLLLSLGVSIISGNLFSPGGIFALIGGGVICFTYVKSDIQILMEKRRRRKEKKKA